MIRIRTVHFWLCVLLSFTGISFFKIGLANFTPFHAFVIVTLILKTVLAFRKRELNWHQPVDLIVAFIYIVLINLIHFDDIKLSSFIYTVIIFCEFILLYNITRKLSLKEIKHITRAVTILYFTNIVLTSLLIALRLFPGGILASILQIYFYDGRIRPFGFSDEPSYASIILVFSMYVSLKCDNFIYQKKELKWYLTSVLAVFLTDSSYGYMMLALLLLYFILKNNGISLFIQAAAKSRIFSRWEYPAAIAVLVIALGIGINSLHLENNKSVKRLVELFKTLTSSDEEMLGTIKHIAYVDGSASMRVLPTISLFENYSKEPLNEVLFGKGAGRSIQFFSALYEDNITLLGFIPSFIYNYGLIGAGIFLWMFFGLFPKEKLMLGILFFLFIFNADFNTQIFLFILFCIMVSARAESLIKTEQQNG